MAQQIGPKEQQLKSLREESFESKKSRKPKKKPSASELRQKVAKITPKNVKKGTRGR